MAKAANSSSSANIESSEEEQQQQQQQYLSSLSLLDKWHISVYNYRGFWVSAQSVEILHRMERGDFTPRPSDVVLVSMPKSGTTWLKSFAFAAMTRRQYSPLTSAMHPLLKLSPHSCVPCLELDFDSIVSMRSPRLFAMHTPCTLLPPEVRVTCRLVYICREPKDTFTSWFHFHNNMFANSEAKKSLQLDDAFELYCAGKNPYGPFWEHMLVHWRESRQRSNKVLFLKYEDLAEDPSTVMRRLAEFMGCGFSEEEERMGLVEDLIALCSFDSLCKVGEMVDGQFIMPDGLKIKNSNFMRKGIVGDWVNLLTPEMSRIMDAITKHNLKGSELNFD